MRPLDDIAADFDSLTIADFDESSTTANGWERLYELCDEMLAINDVAACAPTMFAVMERLDQSRLGTPGPLVQTLENWRGGYESFLAESLRRKPSPLTVWMVNRIPNVNPPDAATWIGQLQSVAEHPAASDEAKRMAAHFLDYQARRIRREG
jgi:hypothetical protein